MYRLGYVLLALLLVTCKKNDSTPEPQSFTFNGHTLNGETNPSFSYSGVSLKPVLTFTFTDKILESSIANSVIFSQGTNTPVNFTSSLTDENTTLVVTPVSPLNGFTDYSVTVTTSL